MLLQKGVPLEAAHGWKRVACVPPPMAVSQSLLVVLNLVSLSPEVGEISLHLVVPIAGTRASLHVSFPLSCLWGSAKAKSALWWISWPFFPCFLQEPLSCMAEHTLSARCPFMPGLAAPTSCLPIAPHSPFTVSRTRGDPIPHPYEGAAAGFSLQELGGARAPGAPQKGNRDLLGSSQAHASLCPSLCWE